MCLLIIGVVLYVVLSLEHHKSEQCHGLVTAAANTENVEYMKSWMKGVVKNNDFSDLSVDYDGSAYGIKLKDHPSGIALAAWMQSRIHHLEYTETSPPDWKRAGLRYGHEPFSIRFELHKPKGETFSRLSEKNIDAIQYGLGRDSILINLKYPKALSLWGEDVKSDLDYKKILDDVFVYCDGGRF